MPPKILRRRRFSYTVFKRSKRWLHDFVRSCHRLMMTGLNRAAMCCLELSSRLMFGPKT